MALWGTCAGLICIANKLTESEPKPMGLIKAEVSRNWFGRQIESFETKGNAPDEKISIFLKGNIYSLFKTTL